MKSAKMATLLTLFIGCHAWSAEPASDIASRAEIEAALVAKPKTRGLRLRATSEESKSGGDTPVASGEGRIDLNIPFDLNSAELGPQAIAQLEQLQSALKSPVLSESRFLIAGHTDARGEARRNQELALRRANAVTRYLVARGMDATHLQSEGAGETRLLMPDEPNAALNRRVEIRNLGAAQ